MWLFIAIFSILLLVIVALQFPQTQQFLTGKAVSFLEKKLNTEVRLGEINVSFPKSIVLKDIYIEDLQQDTLLYAHRLAIDIDMFALINQNVEINSIELENLTANVSRTLPDTTFNYNFILDAFASDSSATEDTTSSPWKISLLNLELQQIHLTYADELTQTNASLNLGYLLVDIGKFDLNNDEIFVDLIDLRDTRAVVSLTPVPDPDPDEDDTTAAEPIAFNFGMDQLNLENVEVEYTDRTSRQELAVALGKLKIEAEQFDLPNQEIALSSIRLLHSEISYIQKEIDRPDTLNTPEDLPKNVQKNVEEKVDQKAATSPGWTVSLGELFLADNNFRYENFNEPVQDEGMDFNHLLVSNIQMKVNDIRYSENEIQADLNHFSFREKSGFVLSNFTTEIRVDKTKAALNNLLIKTPHTEIKDHIAISYSSLDQVGANIAEMGLDVHLDNTSIGFADILFLQPALASDPSFKKLKNANVVLNTSIDGKVGDLNIAYFKLNALRATTLSLEGQVKGLPDMAKAYFDLQVKNLSTSRQDVVSLIPPGSIPPEYNLPNSIRMTADFTGYIDDFKASANIVTSLGSLVANAALDAGAGEGNEAYHANIKLQQFQLGRLLGQDSTMGMLSLRAKVDGTGLMPENMKAKLEAVIETFEFNQYAYNNIVINGVVMGPQFSGDIKIDDENLQLAFDGNVNMKDSIPDVDFVLELGGADLQALNLSEDELSVKGRIEAHFTGSSLNDMNGDVGIRKVLIVKDGVSYPIDSLIYASINEERKTDISLDSELFSATFNGTINIGDLPEVLQRHVNRYYNLKLDEEDFEEPLKPQNFEFEIVLKDTDLLTDVIFPDINTFIPGRISGIYDSEAANLELQLQIPKLDYAGTKLNSFNLFVNSDPDQLFYAISLDEIRQGDIMINNFAIVGGVQNDIIETKLQIVDSLGQEQYVLAGEFRSIEEAFQFHFSPDALVLNYEPWQVAEENFLQFGGAKPLFANELVISNQGQSIAVNTLNDADSTLQILLDNFNLSTVSRIIESDQDFLTGALDGEVDLKSGPQGLAFTSDLLISNFAYKGDTLGNVDIKANNTFQDRYNVEVAINGNGNEIMLAGFYQTDSVANKLDLNLDIANLNLATIESFTAGQLTNLEGALQGNLNITGSTASPNIRGELEFKNTALNLTTLGTRFTIENEVINFVPEGINFNEFEILDINGNRALVNGNILTQDYTAFIFRLDVSTRDFTVLNTKSDPKVDYYGKVQLDSDIQVRGDLNQPVVDMRLSLGEGTDFYYVIRDDEPATAELEGVVEFIDKDMNMGPIMAQAIRESADTAAVALRGFELSAIIEVKPEASFQVVIDEVAGDYLSLKGSGTLNFGLDPSGKNTLTGRYEIAQGSYQMTFYDFVRRQFSIERGSNITWAGDPLEATVDISAIYTVQTSAYELYQNPAARQQMMFDVYLNMDGELLEPEISFAIKVNEDERSNIREQMSAQLLALNEQESELNKQVFALLILKRFIASNPLDGGDSGGLSSTVRNSVSKILTQQLNRLADKVGGVQLEVDLQSYEDYSSGSGEGRTDLELGLSKNLFNDRVTVSVGGNINLEGGNAGQQGPANDIVGDLSVRYKITEDGRYVLEAFREGQFEGLLDGLVVRTGVGLIFTRQYDRLRELFYKTTEEKKEEND